MTAPAASTVIIVSYRPGDWLRPCIDSVIDEADEVIVVDNASDDRLASRIAEEAKARVIRSRRNAGFAGGVALALPEVRGDLVAVLNDDAVARPGWLPSAAGVLEDPSVGAVTPKVVLRGLYREVLLDDEEWHAPRDSRPLGRMLTSVEVEGREVLAACVGAGLHVLETGPDGRSWRWTRPGQPFYAPVDHAGADIALNGDRVEPGPTVRILNHAGSFLRGHGVAGEYGFGAPDDGRFDARREPFGFSGTAPVFRKETLDRIGAFAPRFFAYNEDTDWCLRARLAGLRVAYDPAATIVHRLSATSGGAAAERVRRLAQRNALLCLARNAPARLAAAEIAGRLGKGRRDPVAVETARLLPWAVASRLAMSRQRVCDPADVWETWAEKGSTWDTSRVRFRPGSDPIPA